MNNNSAFDYNNLFTKAKLYVQRAFEVDRESDLFPFWISLSLEFLARSTLAKISPTLLADTSGSDGSNLLYALGYKTTQKPKSINISIVFERLTKIGIDFTEQEKELGNSIINQRNIELHTGLKGYEDFPIHIWLVDYYRISNILVISQGLTLKDFLGNTETPSAEEMIKGDARKVKKEVMDRIQDYSGKFLRLDKKTRERLIVDSLGKVENKSFKVVDCPSCKTPCPIYGQLISQSEPKLIGDSIKQEMRYLPIKLQCSTCGLKVDGFTELKAIDLGAQFTVSSDLDPISYHGIDLNDLRHEEFDPSSFYGDE